MNDHMDDDTALLERVRMLLAIAQDPGASDNEQRIALERAQRLMDRHAIEMWRVERDTDTREPITERRIQLKGSPVNEAMAVLAGIVARGNRCASSYSWRKAANGRIVIGWVTFYGTRPDIRKAETIWTVMENTRAAMWKVRAHQTRNAKPNAAWRDGYYQGFQEEIARRYATLSDSMAADADGRELVLTRRDMIEEYLDRHVTFVEQPASRTRRISKAARRRGADDGSRQPLGLAEVTTDGHPAIGKG